MIIGIVGYARTGKDTFGKFIIEENSTFRRDAFADDLKKILKPVEEALGFPEKEIMRPLYVTLGETGRKIDPDFWINRVIRRISGNTVITDVRYTNEVTRLLNLGGKIVYMRRPGYRGINETERQSISNIISRHVSIMTEIDNSKDLEHLREQAKAFLKENL